MKWNLYNIVEFLNVYQQYPVLWNIKDKDYSNTKLKRENFQRLFSELDEKQLIGGMDAKQLKAKIKSIKDVYRQQLHKIQKSVKSGCGTEDVYSPKLAWFNQANYLAEVLTTGSSKLNLETTVSIAELEEADPEEKTDILINEHADPTEIDGQSQRTICRKPIILPKHIKKQRGQKRRTEEIASTVVGAVPAVKETNLQASSSVYDTFEKTIQQADNFEEDVLTHGLSNSFTQPMSSTNKVSKKEGIQLVMSKALEYLEKDDEAMIMARGYALKLSKMEPMQRLLADKLINDVLLEGQLGTLTRHSSIFVDPQETNASSFLSTSYSTGNAEEFSSQQNID